MYKYVYYGSQEDTVHAIVCTMFCTVDSQHACPVCPLSGRRLADSISQTAVERGRERRREGGREGEREREREGEKERKRERKREREREQTPRDLHL